MKINEIPCIGDIYNMEISEVRERLSEESKKHRVLADSMNKINMHLLSIERLIKKLQEVTYESDVLGESMYQHITLCGYQGRWSAIDTERFGGNTYLLMKSDNAIGLNILCVEDDDDALVFCNETYHTCIQNAISEFTGEGLKQ